MKKPKGRGWWDNHTEHLIAAKKGWQNRRQKKPKHIEEYKKQEEGKQQKEEKIKDLEKDFKIKMRSIKTEEDWDKLHTESISILTTDEGNELYNKYGSFNNMYYKMTNKNPILFEDRNIILKELGVPATLKLEGDTEGKEMLIDIAKFISEKESKNTKNRRHKFEIQIGTQPISLAGDDSFRAGVPPKKWNEVRNMFPYNSNVRDGKGGYIELEKKGVPSRLLWATHDNFHEYCHTLGEKNEKKCDQFALKMTKEYLKERKMYPKE